MSANPLASIADYETFVYGLPIADNIWNWQSLVTTGR